MSSPQTISGQSLNDFGTKGGEVVPKSRIPIDTGLWDNPVPTESGHVRILLSKAASDALLAAGSCFIVAARATSPDDGSRVAVHCIPCSFERANDAVRVSMGEKPLRRIKSTKP